VTRVKNALRLLVDQPRGAERLLDIVRDYESVNVSEKILRIILSYTGFINQRVWHCE